MADLSDVLDEIYNRVIEIVYPDGINDPSIAGVDTTIVKGWPIREKLDEAMQAGHAMVSIFPTDNERDVTKFETDFKPADKTPATIIPIIDDDTIEITGTVSVPQVVMITVNNFHPGYAYQIDENDTLDDIATALAALIPNAVAVGNFIEVPGAFNLTSNIATPFTASQELGRQERVFMISVWAPTPEIRTLLSKPIPIYFRKNYQFVLNDGFYCHLWYDRTKEIDDLQIPLIYRRNITFRIQYATTSTEIFTTIADVSANISVQETSNMQEHERYVLIVKSPFRDYRKGQEIKDAKEVENILKGHERQMIVKLLKRG